MSANSRVCLPPSRPLRRPAVELPAGACDVHSHVFGPRDAYPLASGHSYTPFIATADDYLNMMRVYGIGRGVLVQPSVYGFDNSVLFDALARAPDRLRGIAVISPNESDHLFHAAHERGIRGIRINDRNPAGLSMKDFPHVAARVQSWGWHIQLQVGSEEIADNLSLIEESPVPVVLDHFGFVDPASAAARSRLTELLKSSRRNMVFVKLSAPYRIEPYPYPFLTAFARQVAELAPESLLWGLDWPHTECFSTMPDDRALIDLVRQWLPSQDLRRQVLSDNPNRLYWAR